MVPDAAQAEGTPEEYPAPWRDATSSPEMHSVENEENQVENDSGKGSISWLLEDQGRTSLPSRATCVSNHIDSELAGLTAEKRVMVSVLVFWLYDAFWLRTIKLAWRVSLSKVRVNLTGDQTVARRRARRVRLKNLVVRLCILGIWIASSAG
ncbi:hypothetical protein PspLS_07736 [Pyricularia sp. CBS 133598]|nr:hypothetical protein PspLS_07736 [Pyricularia sp. CBS 133598]